MWTIVVYVVILVLLAAAILWMALYAHRESGVEAPASVCPRQRDEATLPSQLEHRAHITKDGTCSYCGSMSEALFMDAVLAGCRLGPTDKNYKVYVDVPNARHGRPVIKGSSNHEYSNWVKLTSSHRSLALDSGWTREYFEEQVARGTWVYVTTETATKTMKFYFQHLSLEGRAKFIETLNNGVAQVGHPGHFYVLPYFVSREKKSA